MGIPNYPEITQSEPTAVQEIFRRLDAGEPLPPEITVQKIDDADATQTN